jgi:hypothetical protein
MKALALALASSLVALGGCDSCGGKARRTVQSHLGWPDQPTAERLTRKHVEMTPELGKDVCGIEVRGLSDVKLGIKKALLPGLFDVEIDAAPIPAPRTTDAGKADASAGKKPGPKRDAGRDAASEAGVSDEIPKRCLAVLLVMIKPVLAADGTVADWALGSAELSERKTPGHEWKPPSSGGGGWD